MKKINLNHTYSYENLKDCLGDSLDVDSIDDIIDELNFLMGELRKAKKENYFLMGELRKAKEGKK